MDSKTDSAIPTFDAFAASKLLNSITVMRLGTRREVHTISGGFSELPKGTEVKVCGIGFNERTVLLNQAGELFVAFVRDLPFDAKSADLDDGALLPGSEAVLTPKESA